MNFFSSKLTRILLYVVLAFLGLLLVLQAVNSLHWRMEQDTPLLHYAAFLMNDFDYIPYRDIFETSMPGTFIFHSIVGGLFGYSDLPFFIVNLVLLAVVMVAVYLFLSRFDKMTALFGVILFGLFYFGKGQTIVLQRDFLGLIPVALALLTIPSKRENSPGLGRFILCGFLLGCSVLFKPHLAISLPVFLVFLLWHRKHSQAKPKLLRSTLLTGAGFVVPMGLTALWLALNNVLATFLDIFWNYLPLHTGISGAHEVLRGADRLAYLVKNFFRAGGYPGLVVCAIVVAFWLFSRKKIERMQRASILFLIALSSAYVIYPVFGGKFWSYHYIPFALFISMTAALCIYTFFKEQENNNATLSLIVIAIFLGAILFELKIQNYTQNVIADIHPTPALHTPKNGRVDEIAGWLESNLEPGDTVQPLDWTGGSIHAMLLSEAKLATKFMYDYHFYHDVSNPYIQALRDAFIEELRATEPTFIIQISSSKPWVSGPDTTDDFPALEKFVSENYVVAYQGDGYSILEYTAAAD